MESNDAARFDAVCYIADGKPELYDTVSAFSFAANEERVPDTIDEYLECCQPADTRFGVCAVGGAVNINGFKVHDKVHDDALVVPSPPAPPTAPQSVVSDEGMYPVSALHAHEPDMSFMERFAVELDLTGAEPTLAMHCVGPVAPVDSVSVAEEDSEDDDEGLPPPQKTLGFGYSALTSLAACMLFFVCAAAVPSAASAFGGVSMGADAAPPVGGVVHGHPEMLLATTTAFSTSSIENRGLGSTQNYPTHDLSAAPEHTDDEVGGAGVLKPAAIPPFQYWQPAGWYHNLHGRRPGWVWHPGPSQPPVAAPTLPVPPSPGGAPPSPTHSELPSPDYTPPASDEEGEGGPSSIERRTRLVAHGATDYNNIGTFSFCSTHDFSGSADTGYVSEGSGASSPRRCCNSGTGSPGRCGSG
ncbi:hypothetical protein CYMTET_20762 [Cymbomonas tetramitiformis]|uniref:Uncharacterized protein n=1 Tax=Cymbomonas tetramitiformis TaxID=36881 RepID=A0AAE0G3N9_9CHLO|nr:hypothetical protein CYMTET_20762 [Cymbomonas tetramitiformis]